MSIEQGPTSNAAPSPTGTEKEDATRKAVAEAMQRDPRAQQAVERLERRIAQAIGGTSETEESESIDTE